MSSLLLPSGNGQYSTDDLERALLNYVSSFYSDDRTHLFSQALLITLNSSFAWSTDERILTEALCEEFLQLWSLPRPYSPLTPPLTRSLSMSPPRRRTSSRSSSCASLRPTESRSGFTT